MAGVPCPDDGNVCSGVGATLPSPANLANTHTAHLASSRETDSEGQYFSNICNIALVSVLRGFEKDGKLMLEFFIRPIFSH